ncbi:MAG: hypothetical protein Q7K39_04380 [Candidatus Magasanikbacteria bacterium]|nr:hypothetical protein [Candidatus Magasanikbacteria bacterium]
MEKEYNQKSILDCFSQPREDSEEKLKELAIISLEASWFMENYSVNPVTDYFSAYRGAIIKLAGLLEIKDKGNTAEDARSLLDSLELMSAALGASQTGIVSYTHQEFTNCLAVNFEGYDRAKALYTVSNFLGYTSKELRAYLPAVIVYLNEYLEQKKSQYTFAELITLVVFLFCLWSEFAFLSFDQQEILLTNYFFFSILVGVPVRSVLEAFLFEKSYMVQRYVSFDVFLLDCLNSNQESYQFSDNKENFEFGKLVKNCGVIIEKKHEQEPNFDYVIFVKGFVKEQMANAPSLFASAYLEEALTIFCGIESADLINQFQFDADFGDDDFVKQMILLVFCFYTKQYSRVTDYFKSGNLVVTPAQLMTQLVSDAETKTNSNLAGELFAFKDFLLTNKILKPSDGDVEFDEATGEFKWNEAVSK